MVVVQQRMNPPAGVSDALAEELHDRIKLRPPQRPVRLRSPEPVVEVSGVPLPGGDLGHDLLSQHIQRGNRHRDHIEPTGPDRLHEGHRFEQLIASQREQPPLGDEAQRMPRAPDALQERRNRPRRSNLNHEVDVPHIDPQFERRRGHHRLEFARLQLAFGLEPNLGRERPVVAADGLIAEDLRQLKRHPFGHAAGVDEDHRAAVRVDEFDDPGIDLRP